MDQIRELLQVYLRVQGLVDLGQSDISDVPKKGKLFCGFDISDIPYFCIGLDPGNNFSINYKHLRDQNDFPSLSEQHCSIVREENTRWLHDHGSDTGTYIGRVGINDNDFVRIDSGYENKIRMSNGDIIGLLPYHGDFLLKINYSYGILQ